ncbi:glycoside hydrolase family 32 protein [Dellaglioa carnosa]|uniref:Sucrose-6-phosphate hydrolase n=1 Tax=Dellaglioa carnosa TaxID=2995136 RepID=A0ABT4JLR2_9LACO|nr:glycoside hydrolase family 32 protein [Dellaglioa carnosa]MCZ2491305.1 glycoside hydrolase family 32 protein [Dellaglioa carnosa]MCZ2494383.1 glycoside hydrolase family 32 protein [Dellaglioa carnosa]MDK1731201.1 glycoside hydrolase family 32 protein [Dellaglioa carnosa]
MKNETVNYPEITNERYRLNYHITAPAGWMNDPNGFCFYKGYYHIFYQHHPESVEWGPMHWGHSRSKDLVNWERLPIALFPGDKEDKDGCFSGSAIVKDDRLYLIYTGHNLKDENDPDSYWQNQNLAFSDDGINFQKYAGNPVISIPPADNAADFRDPKIWYKNGKYYIVIGSKNEVGLGRVIMYSSENLEQWDYLGPIATAKSVDSEGFVWECPDLFEIEGQDVLIMSPQGIKADELKYRNFFQTGYLIGKFDEDTHTLSHGEFTELDFGHDFYATQSMLTPDGRRIAFGWMDMWESPMPEQQDGWAGALTFPRELKMKAGKLLMTPVKEIEKLRKKVLLDVVNPEQNTISFKAPTKSFEYLANFDGKNDVVVKVQDSERKLLLELNYRSETGKVTLQKYNDDLLRETNITVSGQMDIHLLMDNSSAELFVNNGEACFSERIYDEKELTIETSSGSTNYDIKIYELGGEM